MIEEEKDEDLAICGGDNFLADQASPTRTSSGSRATFASRSLPLPSREACLRPTWPGSPANPSQTSSVSYDPSMMATRSGGSSRY
jgi:hypothetical protein